MVFGRLARRYFDEVGAAGEGVRRIELSERSLLAVEQCKRRVETGAGHHRACKVGSEGLAVTDAEAIPDPGKKWCPDRLRAGIIRREQTLARRDQPEQGHGNGGDRRRWRRRRFLRSRDGYASRRQHKAQ